MTTLMFMTFRWGSPLSLCLPGVLLLSVSTVHAQVLVNGDFESPDIPDNTTLGLFTTISGWGVVPFLVDGAAIPVSWPTLGASGRQYVDISNNPGNYIAQTFTIGAGEQIAGASWADNTDSSASRTSAPYTMRLYAGPAITGTLLWMENFQSQNNSFDWVTRNVTPPTFLAAGTYTLQFFGTNTLITSDVLIDNVEITTAPVPEPSTWAILAGIIVLGAAHWHRRRR